MDKSTFQKLLDAGAHFTELSRKQAESLVKNLVQEGEVRRADADKTVQMLLDRGKQTAERISDTVQREVAKQVTALSERFDELEDRFESLAERLQASAGRGQPAPSTAKKAPAKKKATAKKAPAKKKATAKKAPAKKKATAKKAAAGSSGVRKVSTSRQR